MNIHFINQLKIIKLANEYLKQCKKNGIDISLSPKCFMTTWAQTPGYFTIKFLTASANIKSIIFFIKDLFFIGFHHDLFCKNKIKTDKIDNLIVSYCTKKNFRKDGSFFDDYFKISSKDNNLFWFLISLDNFEPLNINKNILVVKKKKISSYNFFFLIKKIFLLFIKNFFSLTKILHKSSSSYIFMEEIKKIFSHKYKGIQINNLIVNYEGIPFQHGIIQKMKEINFNTKIFCYLHCAGWPLQLDLIYKLNLIDKLVVSGNDQRNVLKKFLNWPNKKLAVIPSLRFKKNKNNSYGGFIFVPYNVENFKSYIEKFKIFLNTISNKSFNNFKIRIHPLNKNSDRHKKFAIELKKIIKFYKNKFSNKLKKNCSVIFGSATGITIQSLEYGVKIYHIPSNEYTDVFSQKIWPNINVEQVMRGIYVYTIKTKNQMFKETSSSNNFNKYFLPLISSH